MHCRDFPTTGMSSTSGVIDSIESGKLISPSSIASIMHMLNSLFVVVPSTQHSSTLEHTSPNIGTNRYLIDPISSQAPSNLPQSHRPYPADDICPAKYQSRVQIASDESAEGQHSVKVLLISSTTHCTVESSPALSVSKGRPFLSSWMNILWLVVASSPVLSVSKRRSSLSWLNRLWLVVAEAPTPRAASSDKTEHANDSLRNMGHSFNISIFVCCLAQYPSRRSS
mmetsp:Transcript_44336/g.79534  ORF Transcript_44336/g.79534 Transcript_44336/m.79534 type:complete len:226 (-) Transcript_44336:300-977(-)